MLSWDECKAQIHEKKNPCYLRGYSSDLKAYHAFVYCGYDFDNGKYYNDKKRMYIMDPNLNTWQKVPYDSIYDAPYEASFEVEKSLYQK